MCEMSTLTKVAIYLMLSTVVVALAMLLLPYWYVILIMAGILLFIALLTIVGLAYAADILNGEQCSNKLTLIWAKLSVTIARKIYVLKCRIDSTI